MYILPHIYPNNTYVHKLHRSIHFRCPIAHLHIKGMLYKTLISKTFPQESSEAFLNLENSALRRTKKTSPACFNRVL